MNDFDYYLNEGKVLRREVDFEIAKSLVKDSKERVMAVEPILSEQLSKIVFENVYDALRDILDAILFSKGYKSYLHEASIMYLKKCGVDDSVLHDLDGFRIKRNGSKYYGKPVSFDDAKEILEFYKKNSEKFISFVDKNNIVQENRQSSKKIDDEKTVLK